MTELIQAQGLTRYFGLKLAVDHIDLSVQQGEVLGFLGPNGAGKSTSMKMLTGFLAPSSGRAALAGYDVQTASQKAKRHLGYLPEGAPAYGDMTTCSFLNFIADLRQLRGAYRQQRLDFVIDRTHIGSVWEQPIETLSKGYKRRVGLAQAILHDPEILIMDEPTDGLDPIQKHEVRNLIRELSTEKSIIISTHLLEEVVSVCSRAVIIADGKLRADDTPQALEARSRWHGALSMTLDTVWAEKLCPSLAANPNVATVEQEPAGAERTRLILFPNRDKDVVADLLDMFRQDGLLNTPDLVVHDLTLETGRLDEVFREIAETTPY